jgi:hypothetical protein
LIRFYWNILDKADEIHAQMLPLSEYVNDFSGVSPLLDIHGHPVNVPSCLSNAECVQHAGLGIGLRLCQPTLVASCASSRHSKLATHYVISITIVSLLSDMTNSLTTTFSLNLHERTRF